MTFEEVAVLALARARRHTQQVNENRALLYARIGQRQQELFAQVARINPDYYGVCAHAPVTDGEVNLLTIADPVPTPEMIQRIEVYDEGTSDYEAGDEVVPVRLEDKRSVFPPRVTLRSGVLRGVDTDLDDVAELRIYYSRIPTAGVPGDADREVELPEQYQLLLAIDAERDIYRRGDPAAKDALMASASADEQPLLAEYLAHAVAYTGSAQSRYG